MAFDVDRRAYDQVPAVYRVGVWGKERAVWSADASCGQPPLTGTLAHIFSSSIPNFAVLVIIHNASCTTARTPRGADCVAKACVDALCPTRYSGLIVIGFYSKVCRDLGISVQDLTSGG